MAFFGIDLNLFGGNRNIRASASAIWPYIQFWEFNTLLFITTKRKDLNMYKLFLHWEIQYVPYGLKEAWVFDFDSSYRNYQIHYSFNARISVEDHMLLTLHSYLIGTYVSELSFQMLDRLSKKGVIFFICGDPQWKLFGETSINKLECCPVLGLLHLFIGPNYKLKNKELII